MLELLTIVGTSDKCALFTVYKKINKNNVCNFDSQMFSDELKLNEKSRLELIIHIYLI